MDLNESENSEDYGYDTESIDDDDPILKEFDHLNLPIYGQPTIVDDEPVLPPEEEIKLLDQSELIISPQTKTSFSYNYHLQAIVKHKGESASYGHYVTNILDQTYQWYCYDDSSVHKISLNQAIKDISEKEAYILFYVHSSIFQNLL